MCACAPARARVDKSVHDRCIVYVAAHTRAASLALTGTHAPALARTCASCFCEGSSGSSSSEASEKKYESANDAPTVDRNCDQMTRPVVRGMGSLKAH